MRSAGALAMLHNVSSVVAFCGIVAISGVFKSPLWYVINMLIGAGIIVHQYESHHICLDVS